MEMHCIDRHRPRFCSWENDTSHENADESTECLERSMCIMYGYPTFEDVANSVGWGTVTAEEFTDYITIPRHANDIDNQMYATRS